MSALYDRSADLLRHLYDHRVHDTPVVDTITRFPGHRAFEAAWQAIRDEALAVASRLHQVPRFHELMAEQADISHADQRDWRMFVLKAYGVPVRANLARCPRLAQLLAADSDVLSAALSFLAPRKHIPEHRGPFRGVLRYYLGLDVPRDSAGRPATELLIDGIPHRIASGESLLWDDTFRHEVRHHSDEPRIALLLDIRRRGLPPDMAVLSRLLIGAVAGGVRLRQLLPGDPFRTAA